MPTCKLTEIQVEARNLLRGPATHTLLRGGSRSGKTFILTRAVAMRAIKARETRHALFRLRFNHIKQSVIFDTFPKVMKLCFPEVPYHLNQTDWFVELPNKSTIVFGGLDEKDRTEKILGTEYATVYLNECSQIGYDARNKVITRLAQLSPLRLKAYYDANPPSMGHWLYRMFEQKLEPKSGQRLAKPDDYASMMMNPDKNRANLAPDYIAQLEALPEKDRRRFLLGEYLAQVDGALWTIDGLEACRIERNELPPLRRVVVAVDPSGCSGPEDSRSDEIGIVTVGLDDNGMGYVLEDSSGRYSPDGWAREALKSFDRWQADSIVAERNFGGAMVQHTIRSARASVPFREVVASRGKMQRAEPVAALYEQGKVWHVGRFPELEEQQCNFSTAGYQGMRSPDRCDAAVWGLSELMVTQMKGVGLYELAREGASSVQQKPESDKPTPAVGSLEFMKALQD